MHASRAYVYNSVEFEGFFINFRKVIIVFAFYAWASNSVYLLYAFSTWSIFQIPSKMSSSSRNSDHEEETSSNGSEVLENGNKRVQGGSDILNRETKRVRRLETLDESAKNSEHVYFPKMVKLNIGGHFFSTSLETLTKDPGTFKLPLQLNYSNIALQSREIFAFRDYLNKESLLCKYFSV